MRATRAIGLAALVVIATAASGCGGGEPAATPVMQPAGETGPIDTAPPPPPEPDPEPEPPPPPPTEPEIVLDLAKWDAATSEEREAAARTMDQRVPRFDFLRMETFACGGQEHEVAIYNHVLTDLEFVLVPAGALEMGSPTTETARKGDEVQRNVTLTRPFLIGRTEVTQRAWFRHITTRGKPQWKGDDNPMETATYHDMKAFLYRAELALPTEAQWEYACRAGTQSAFTFGADPKDLGDYAWFETNSGGTTHPVGQKKPNAFGLFDVHGNVWERCTDKYDRYGPGAVTDPTGSEDAVDMICRGGSHANMPAALRSAFRYPMNPGDKHGGVGLRVVWVIPPPR